MQRPDRGFIVFCVLLFNTLELGVVVMKSLSQKCIREGGFFLVVGVDIVFACKIHVLFVLSTLSLCLIQNYFRSKCCKYC